MIKNERQYNTTKKKLRQFEQQLEALNNLQDIDPLEKELNQNSLEGFIDEFKSLLTEYETLKKGANYIKVESIEDIPQALIKCRISSGLTHAELGNKLDMPEQQIQRYEACNYSTASIERLQQVATAMNVFLEPTKIKLASNPLNVSDKINQTAMIASQKLRRTKSLIVFQ